MAEIGKDLVEITLELEDGLYEGGLNNPRKVDRSAFDVLTDTITSTIETGVTITQPDKVYKWVTGRDEGKLQANRSFQVAVSVQENEYTREAIYIADRKERALYRVDLKQKVLWKMQGADEAGYRHSEAIKKNYMYIGEISDIVNQFTSNGFSIQEAK